VTRRGDDNEAGEERRGQRRSKRLPAGMLGPRPVVAVVGRPNVGKSTLLNAVLGEPIAIVSSHPQTTRDSILGVVTWGAAQFGFLDTPGLHAARNKLGSRMNDVARDAAREADAVVLVTDGGPDADAGVLRDVPEGARLVVALNKIDRLADKTALLPVLEAWNAVERPIEAVVPISAQNRNGVERLLGEIEKLLPEGDRLWPEDEISDKPVRFFVAEFVREQILRATRAEVPHGVAVVVERFEDADVPRIELAIHVDKESHKPIVIGEGGLRLKEIGTKARKRVESMMGRHVHLKLWVRVTPGWYEDERALRELGYA
jgi:GTP-binding protein Era